MISKVSPFLPLVSVSQESAEGASQKTNRKCNAKRAKPDGTPLHNRFREVEICCEEARSAARLKRFDSAFGLFATAQVLLENAIQTGGEWRAEACERLQNVSCEMAAYRELARSAARPLRKTRR